MPNKNKDKNKNKSNESNKSQSQLPPHKRIPEAQRKFRSDAVDAHIRATVSKLNSSNSSSSAASEAAQKQLITAALPQTTIDALAILFENCWPNTLDTTVRAFTPPTHNTTADAFIITGDIEHMWLRDSTNQVAPYFFLLPTDARVRQLVLGLVLRQAWSVAQHPYSNAFKYTIIAKRDRVSPAAPHHAYESKYELDSLAAFLKLSNAFHAGTINITATTNSNATQEEGEALLTSKLLVDDKRWVEGVRAVLRTMREQQRGTMEELGKPAYSFVRQSAWLATDTLIMDGIGPPARRCGMVKSAFRPSDDANTYPFSILSNAMAAVELARLADMLDHRAAHPDIASEARAISAEIKQAIETHGRVQHAVYGEVYAYEVDCFGSAAIMDDANVPSLLSLPYLGYLDVADPTYQRTRRLVLSDHNPFHFSGKVASGIGGPHVGMGRVWPMSIIMRAITAGSVDEIVECVDMLVGSARSTGFMHESFSMDDFEVFSRPWFAWANALFGELVMGLLDERLMPYRNLVLFSENSTSSVDATTNATHPADGNNSKKNNIKDKGPATKIPVTPKLRVDQKQQQQQQKQKQSGGAALGRIKNDNFALTAEVDDDDAEIGAVGVVALAPLLMLLVVMLVFFRRRSIMALLMRR